MVKEIAYEASYYKKASPLPISVMQRSVLEQMSNAIPVAKTMPDVHMLLLCSSGLGIGQGHKSCGASGGWQVMRPSK